MKLATMKDVFQALIDGKKVRRADWKKDCYIYIIDNNVVDEGGDRFYPDLYPDDEWELYQEPTDTLHITESDVGRAVRLRNGDITMITGFSYCSEGNKVWADGCKYSTSGRYTDVPHSLDIVAFV